ncbi:MAG: hypothetical protein FWC70_01210 [Defluviitaleaceae bacterium]|nr:hypothetical protein [Defluviitaleaceae bacterium]
MIFPKTTTSAPLTIVANGIENREGEAGNRGLLRVFRRSLSGLLNALRYAQQIFRTEAKTSRTVQHSFPGVRRHQ